MSEPIIEAKDKMEKSISVLKKDFTSIRAGRANPHVLDKIAVEYYGAMTPLNQMGNISVPEPRLLTIALWETKFISQVEKAILKSDLGITPSNDGKVIRLTFPELTEERRKDIVKNIHKMMEETKVAVRAIRRDYNENLKKMKKSNQLTEDDLLDGETEIQKITDDYIKKIDELGKLKEKEIMEV